jgi:tRNA-specific 2-thiouridylase
VTPDGRTIGRHDGLAYYTLGQRQGLGVGGTRDGGAAPWFVAGKDRVRNALIVVQGHDDPRLYADVVETGAMHWISGAAPDGRRFAAKTRYRMADARCTVEPLAADRWRVRFDAPQWAPTAGQYLVLYDGETCLGGAVIESAHASELAPALAAVG